MLGLASPPVCPVGKLVLQCDQGNVAPAMPPPNPPFVWTSHTFPRKTDVPPTPLSHTTGAFRRSPLITNANRLCTGTYATGDDHRFMLLFSESGFEALADTKLPSQSDKRKQHLTKWFHSWSCPASVTVGYSTSPFDTQADASQSFLSLWVAAQDCPDSQGRCDPPTA